MCTAISVLGGDHYFGRNLDYEYDFGERIVIAPREYSFKFRCGKMIKKHDAIIGMGIVKNGYPLWFDAVNESGLAMAGLMFSGNCEYRKKSDGKRNVASFELIPWVLSNCKSVSDARHLIKNTNVTDEAFSDELPPTPLHYLIGDKLGAIVVELTAEGTKIYDNPTGVLTNNPTFDMQMFNLNNYMGVSRDDPKNRFSEKIKLSAYSRGMGGIGLPGDLSSMSRFVKSAYICSNSVYPDGENEMVNHFFHTLYSVFQQKGCVKVGDNYEITRYCSCCNTDRGIYYYTTYDNSSITAVDLHRESLDTNMLIEYELIKNCEIKVQNDKQKSIL